MLFTLSVLAMFIPIGRLTTPVLWIWGMVDAYQTCECQNREAGLAGACHGRSRGCLHA
jgi:hypothetical protein